LFHNKRVFNFFRSWSQRLLHLGGLNVWIAPPQGSYSLRRSLWGLNVALNEYVQSVRKTNCSKLSHQRHVQLSMYTLTADMDVHNLRSRLRR